MNYLDSQLTSNRYSLLEKKKVLKEQLYIARDSNDEVIFVTYIRLLFLYSVAKFRRLYDIAARDREAVAIGSACKSLEDKHQSEMSASKQLLKQQSLQIRVFTQQIEILKRENESLREDCKKKDEHLKILNKLAIVSNLSC